MTRITDMCGDLQAESSEWLLKSSLAGGGGILCPPHHRPHSLIIFALEWVVQIAICAACSATATIYTQPLQGVTWTAAPSDLMTLTFVFGITAERQQFHGQTSCQFWCFCDFSLSRYGQTCTRLTTWPYYLDLWPLTSPRMSVMRVLVLHPCIKFEVRRSLFRKIIYSTFPFEH